MQPYQATSHSVHSGIIDEEKSFKMLAPVQSRETGQEGSLREERSLLRHQQEHAKWTGMSFPSFGQAPFARQTSGCKTFGRHNVWLIRFFQLVKSVVQ
jgi:hypothetical protein